MYSIYDFYNDELTDRYKSTKPKNLGETMLPNEGSVYPGETLETQGYASSNTPFVNANQTPTPTMEPTPNQLDQAKLSPEYQDYYHLSPDWMDRTGEQPHYKYSPTGAFGQAYATYPYSNGRNAGGEIPESTYGYDKSGNMTDINPVKSGGLYDYDKSGGLYAPTENTGRPVPATLGEGIQTAAKFIDFATNPIGFAGKGVMANAGVAPSPLTNTITGLGGKALGTLLGVSSLIPSTPLNPLASLASWGLGKLGQSVSAKEAKLLDVSTPPNSWDYDANGAPLSGWGRAGTEGYQPGQVFDMSAGYAGLGDSTGQTANSDNSNTAYGMSGGWSGDSGGGGGGDGGGGGGDGGGGGGCIIVTACHGRDSDEVNLTRRYRDDKMNTRQLIGYYILAEKVVLPLMDKSKTIAHFVRKHLVGNFIKSGEWFYNREKKVPVASYLVSKGFLALCSIIGLTKSSFTRSNGEVIN